MTAPSLAYANRIDEPLGASPNNGGRGRGGAGLQGAAPGWG